MAAKTEQLQIRITASQKAALHRAPRAAGMDVSGFVLARVLRPLDDQVASILHALAGEKAVPLSLAALNDLLSACPPVAFADTVSDTVFTPSLLQKCSPFLQNYVAAMVEQAAHR